ncbi:MAG: HNH endonuclease, partial [Actinomycetota bacterium]
MKAFVAVTDGEWYRFLKSLSPIDEANFWQPSPSGFRVLQPGEPFLFKLHYPEHFIVGGGLFAHYSPYPASLAWEAFGDRNGAPTLAEMRRRIERYRRSSDPTEDYTVGCIILEQLFFFERDEWIAVPESFKRNIVKGKTYDLSGIEG